MKVKLLKDLPDIKAGVIFVENKEKKNDFIYKYQKFGREVEYSFNRDSILSNQDWFEEVHAAKQD